MAQKLPATQALTDLGYLPLHDRVYKATWSTPDVEHFIYLVGGPRGLGVSFGIRNPVTEPFAVQSIVKYVGDDFRDTMRTALQYDQRSTCTTRYWLSLFDPFWSRPFRSLFDPMLGTKIQQILTEHVLPVVRDVTSVEQLLSLLLADEKPCPWFIINGAIRAAQIVALAGKCGRPAAQTRTTLEAYERWIAQGFPKSSPMREAPAEYIGRVLEDWGAFSRSHT